MRNKGRDYAWKGTRWTFASLGLSTKEIFGKIWPPPWIWKAILQTFSILFSKSEICKKKSEFFGLDNPPEGPPPPFSCYPPKKAWSKSLLEHQKSAMKTFGLYVTHFGNAPKIHSQSFPNNNIHKTHLWTQAYNCCSYTEFMNI